MLMEWYLFELRGLVFFVFTFLKDYKERKEEEYVTETTRHLQSKLFARKVSIL